MNAFTLAAPSSGSGKTTIALALMRALEDVQAYKIGPDYIDPMYHRMSTGSPSYNLDFVLMGEEGLKKTFAAHSDSNTVAILEGVMGLFDGRDHGTGSSAHVSQILGVPVVLVLDGRALSTSAVAIVQGFRDFEIEGKKTPIAGIILNRIKSDRVFELLKDEIEYFTDVPVFGYFPEDPNLVLPSRHLGLIPPEELESTENIIERAAEAVRVHVDLEKLLAHTVYENTIKKQDHVYPDYSGIKIAVARDEAFSFYYQENLELLEKLGVELVYFSPIRDRALPEGISGLYLGGGFPEVFIKKLEENEMMREDIKSQLDRGLYCYAECGGYVYLAETIVTDRSHRGVGFFHNTVEMTERLQDFGYCELIGKYRLPAHEFHHTRITTREETEYACVRERRSVRTPIGQVKRNTIGLYPHVHFGGRKDLIIGLLEKLRGECIESES